MTRMMTALFALAAAGPALATPFTPIWDFPTPNTTCLMPADAVVCPEGQEWSNRDCRCMEQVEDSQPAPERIVGFVWYDPEPVPGICPDPPLGPWTQPVYFPLESGGFAVTTVGAMHELQGHETAELLGQAEFAESAVEDAAYRDSP